jgi:hypothetical protein
VSTCSYLSAVNQKLLFAKKLIKLIEANKPAFNDRHMQVAIAQSITLHLGQAWAWHLQDVASNYKVKDPSIIQSVDDLEQSLLAEGKRPAESTELKQLFYSDMLYGFSQLSSLPVIRKAEMDVDRLPMLSLDDVSNSKRKAVDWHLTMAIDWSKKMNELVERHRDMMIEF